MEGAVIGRQRALCRGPPDRTCDLLGPCREGIILLPCALLWVPTGLWEHLHWAKPARSQRAGEPVTKWVNVLEQRTEWKTKEGVECWVLGDT